jgi:hypothetical protein
MVLGLLRESIAIRDVSAAIGRRLPRSGYVYDRVGGNSGPGMKALVADELTAIQNTEEKFELRFPVELSEAGEMPEDRYPFDPTEPDRPHCLDRITHDDGGGGFVA